MGYQEFFKGFVESKKQEGCEGATAIFFMVKKAVTSMLSRKYSDDYLSFLNMKVIAKMMKEDGSLNGVTEKHQQIAFKYDTLFSKSYHLPWVIERIENSNCDHKWCEIVRDKIEENEDREVLDSLL